MIINYSAAKATASHSFHSLPNGTIGLDYKPENREAIVSVKRESYPKTVIESIDDTLKYRRGVIAAVTAFAADKPFRGTLIERFDKLAALHVLLCEIYQIFPALVATKMDGTHSGNSTFAPTGNCITLRGRLSVITYLHEFGHALGKGETGTCKWSLNLFKRCLPKSYAKLVPSAHTLVAATPIAFATTRPRRRQSEERNPSTK